MKEPIWATELLIQVCKDEGRSKRPEIDWGYSTVNEVASGRYFHSKWRKPQGVIRLVQGTTDKDLKQVFLHEICHWLTRGRRKKVYFFGDKRKRKSSHGKRFYLKLNELLIRYNAFTEEYRLREANYMSRSVNYLKGGETV